MRKSQVSQTVFYIFGIIVIGILLTAGLNYLSKTAEQHRQFLLLQFQQQFPRDVATLATQYGYVQSFTYNIPDTYPEVCFLDLTHRLELRQSPSLKDRAVLYDAAQTSGSTDNVFLIGKDFKAFAVANLTLPSYPYHACHKVGQKSLELTMEGAGRKTLLLTNLTTAVSLDSFKEIQLLSADGMVELILPEGTTARTPDGKSVTSIHIQIVKPDSVHGGQTITSELYQFGPPGTHFDQPIQLRMHYFPAILGVECPAQLVYYRYSDAGVLLSEYNSDKVDCVSKIATFSISDFSIGGVGNGTGNQTLCDLSCFSFSVCTPTGAQYRLCGNPSGCNLLSLAPNDLFAGLCSGGPIQCSDTDGGFDSLVKGTCTDTQPFPVTDRCFNATHIIEAGCDANKRCITQTLSCPVGKACLRGLCQDPTSCSDVKQNGDESDVDCGGTRCDKCIEGKKCVFDVDCLTNYCDPITKICKATCIDTIKNQDESDVDCGGATCGKCVNGKTCNGNTDCQSSRCDSSTKTCVSCTDGFKNYDEIDIDCGGSCPTKCVDGKTCGINMDCQSNSCDLITKRCISCVDGLKNQDETDVDCGGSKCSKCMNSKHCTSGNDCQSTNCASGTCQPLSVCGNNICETGEDVCSVCHFDNPPCMGPCTSGTCESDCVDNSQFVSQNVPTQMNPGETKSVTITMKNTGTTTWDDIGRYATEYKLGSQNPQDNKIFVSTARAGLSVPVSPGGTTAFTFTITAPITPGIYNFQWRMVREYVGWFGDLTPNLAITVGTPVSYLPKGYHDGSDCIQTTGWTCDQNDYTQPLKVHLYKDGGPGVGTFLVEITADQPREPGVAAQCGGNANHGFVYATPQSLKDGLPHTINAYAINIGPPDTNPALTNTPKMINCGGSCSDGIKNQGETDIDCVGTKCGKCGSGMNCTTSTDCLNGNCANKVCAIECKPGQIIGDVDGNGILNRKDWELEGMLAAAIIPLPANLCCVDVAPYLAPNGLITIADWVEEGRIVDGWDPSPGVCPPQPTCFDGIKNQDETDVDCGGAICIGRCAIAKTCNVNNDCQTSLKCVGTPKLCRQEQTGALTVQSDSSKDGTVTHLGAVNTNEQYISLGNEPPSGCSIRKFRGFLYFDTSSIPDNAVITSAQLTVNGFNFARCKCNNAGTIDVHKCNFYPLGATDYNSCIPGPGPVDTGARLQISDNGKCGTGTVHTVNIPRQYIGITEATQFKLISEKEDCACTDCPCNSANEPPWFVAPMARICSVPPGWGSSACDADDDRPTLTVNYKYYTP